MFLNIISFFKKYIGTTLTIISQAELVTSGKYLKFKINKLKTGSCVSMWEIKKS